MVVTITFNLCYPGFSKEDESLYFVAVTIYVFTSYQICIWYIFYMENFEQPVSREGAASKSMKLGFFSLTAEDHRLLSSTPDDRLKDNPGKALYEVLDDEEIGNYIQGMIDAQYDKALVENGFAQNQLDELAVSIPFLESVGRLPEEFRFLLSELVFKK